MRPRPMAGLLFLIASVVGAQQPSSVAEIEASLPALVGRERAGALARPTERIESDDPKKARAYGAQALQGSPRELDYGKRITTLSSMSWAHITLSGAISHHGMLRPLMGAR